MSVRTHKKNVKGGTLTFYTRVWKKNARARKDKKFGITVTCFLAYRQTTGSAGKWKRIPLPHLVNTRQVLIKGFIWSTCGED